MIINGNYVWTDYKKLIPNLEEVFVDYTSEDKREQIQQRLNNIEYRGYHDFGYVNSYYKKFILKYRDEILDNFFAKIKIPRTLEREEALFTSKAETLDDTAISLVKGSEDTERYYYLVKENIDKEGFDKTRNLFQQFNIPLDNFDKFRFALNEIINAYNMALKKVEKDHPCDVFRDLAVIEDNYNRDLIEILNFAIERGYLVTENDDLLLSRFEEEEDFSLFDNLYKLDFAKELFDTTFDLPGLISYFSSNYEESLTKGTEIQRFCVIVNRLRYLWRRCNVKFEVLNEEEVLKFNPYVMDEDLQKRILQEYKIQIMKNSEKFVDTEIADMIEIKRRQMESRQYEGCKFCAQKDIYSSNGYVNNQNDSGLLVASYKRNKSGVPYAIMRIDEGVSDDKESILKILMHESLHNQGAFLQIIDRKTGYDKMGLIKNKVKMNYDEVYGSDFNEENILILNENITERMNGELSDLYIQKFGLDDIVTSDIVVEPEKFISSYTYTDFLTEEFYQLFKTPLKQTFFDGDYDIYYPHGDYNGVMSYLKSKVKSKIDKKRNPEEYYGKGAVLDYHLASDLGLLINQWIGFDSLFRVEEITPEDLKTGACIANMDENLFKRYTKLKSKKDKIIRKMLKDLQTAAKLDGDMEEGVVIDADELSPDIIDVDNIL